MDQSIPNLPISPKPFVKCWHLLWLSTAEQNLKLSSAVKPFNSNYFCKIYLHLSEWIAPLLGKITTFLQTEKCPCVVLKCWKCFAIISYNVKHRHTILSIFINRTYVYEISITYKNRSPLRLYEVTGGEVPYKRWKKSSLYSFFTPGFKKSITLSCTD